MSYQVDASTQHDAVNSPESTAPTKYSLRILEPGSSNRSTRKEDLANGPLLLGLGDGHEGPFLPSPELYLGHRYSGHNRLEESVPPSVPLRLPEALATGPMTSSTVSQTGPTHSLPTQTESATSAIQSLLTELTERSSALVRGCFLFSQAYEFLWQDSRLCFGGGVLEIVRTPHDGFLAANPGWERASIQPHEPATCSTSLDVVADNFVSTGVAGMGGSIEHMLSAIFPENLEVPSTMSSVLGNNPSSMDGDATSEPFDPNLLIAMHKCADWAVELLMEDFFKSYAPQASKGQTTRASHKPIAHGSDNRESKSLGVNGKVKAGLNSRKRKAVGSDGGIDGEES